MFVRKQLAAPLQHLLPTYKSLIHAGRRKLAAGTPVGLIFLDVKRFHEILQVQSSMTVNRILLLLKEAIRRKISALLPSDRILTVEHLWADDFVILVTLENTAPQEHLLEVAKAFQAAMHEELNGNLKQLTGCVVEMYIGCSLIEPGTGIKDDLRLYNALREAQHIAKAPLGLDGLKHKKEFIDILGNKRLRALYQPIVSLASGELLGWEALTRGPQHSYFERPAVIFRFAEELGLLFTLEKACREKAISSIGDLNPEQKIFLNVHPRTMSDLTFVKGETLQMLNTYGLSPRNVVFEITERHSIQDFTSFKKVVENYRSQGYRIAIDDVGAGFSGLQSIAEIRPDFIKIDMSLIRNIDQDYSRQSVVAALAHLAENVNCKIIAEGVESHQELNTLFLLGIPYAQGYYLSHPLFPKPAIADNVITHIQHRKIARFAGLSRHLSIGHLAAPALVVREETFVAQVKLQLDASQQVGSSLVLDKGQKPIGLVMRHNLHRILSSPYGVSLFYSRPITSVMDDAPLVLDSQTSLELAAELALNRTLDRLYDDLVVVNSSGELLGIVSTKRLFERLTQTQIELAKGANPLTGLPGNLAIDEELSRRARYAPRSSTIYVDIDAFKSYNDAYGFKQGDQMILLLAKIVLHCTRKYGGKEDFVGHIGGDDLIIITMPEYATQISNRVIQLFDRLMAGCFLAEDRAKKAFYGHDRFGNRGWLPLTSISLAIIECTHQKDYGLLAETAAQLKKHAKSLPGSIVVRDRRAKD